MSTPFCKNKIYKSVEHKRNQMGSRERKIESLFSFYFSLSFFWTYQPDHNADENPVF